MLSQTLQVSSLLCFINKYNKNPIARFVILLYNQCIMRNIDEILPFIIAAIVAVILSFSVVTMIKKSIKFPYKHNTIDSRTQLKEQRWRMNDVRQRQKQLLRDQKQKIRDMQRR